MYLDIEHVRLVMEKDASVHGTNDSQRLQASADVASAMSQSKATSCGDCRVTAAVEHLLYHSHSVCVWLKTREACSLSLVSLFWQHDGQKGKK